MERWIPIFTVIRYYIEIKLSKIIVFISGVADHTKAEFRKVLSVLKLHMQNLRKCLFRSGEKIS